MSWISERQVHTKDCAGHRSNRASWTGSLFGPHLQPGVRAELQTSVHLSCQKKGCLQRVFWPLGLRRELDSQDCWQRLTESQETSYSQRQLDYLTPEIARWPKANVRILLQKARQVSIYRTEYANHSESWLTQHTWNARLWFKIISHDAGRGC